MPLSSQAVLGKWGPIAAADPEGGSGPFHFWAFLQIVWVVVRLFPSSEGVRTDVKSPHLACWSEFRDNFVM